MTNSTLIAIFNGQISNQPVQLCNARDLHSFLESKYQYTDWIKARISDYGFIQDEDYIIVTERTTGRPRKEYHITLDMGKELGMVERNEKGRQIRRYFIECEKRALQKNTQIAPLAEPEKTFSFETTESKARDLIWALFATAQMHTLLGNLEPALQAIGSNFHPMVYSQHREYAPQINIAVAFMKQLIQPFKESNELEWQRLIHNLERVETEQRNTPQKRAKHLPYRNF